MEGTTNTANGGKVAWNTSPGVTTVTDTASGNHSVEETLNITADLETASVKSANVGFFLTNGADTNTVGVVL